ncbi:hypothetical protein [Streptomyces cahuitamycinicus]|uniref:Uncharacterized protein n=1 Tax=Streptomyces cahuitamycinicus TaxID=2070367 RepID=A0A2N8TTJ7_9ACTN|nr:hypothetical protein [Streptomyces cahuitamycinicus]PNG22342.1 hypothetical protein C1J00_10020 [Streptomyces cahuitamycinicus]
MGAKLRLLAWALGLLALAHPALAPLALDVLGVAFAMAVAAVVGVIGWALANISFTLTIAAGLLLAHAFPGVPRWLGRAWVASVAAVSPAKA